MKPVRGNIRIMVADNHPAVRRGVCDVLHSAVDLQVVAEVATTDELMQMLHEVPCDVLVWDVLMPGDNLDILRALHRRYPLLAIVVFSPLPNGPFAARLMQAGARAYVPKTATHEELIQAIRESAGYSEGA